MHNVNSIVVRSHNCRGYNYLNRGFISRILCSVDILFMQEHWLTDSQTALLCNISPEFLSTAFSGFGNAEVLHGRPYSGCAIFWRSCLNLNVDVLKTDNRRMCAVRVTCNEIRLLFINVYMLYESIDSNVDVFSDLLFVTERLITNNLNCHAVIGGDFNVDFLRNCVHTALLRSFCDDQDLHVAAEHHQSSIDFTYHFNMTRFSIFDHFLLSSALLNCLVNSVTVIHDVDNLSDHEPIVLEIELVIDRIVVPCYSNALL